MIGLSTSAQQALSEFLGYTSIACWLGAQFPQVLENIKSQSCEGLALPFLANWLLGDISNLIGCLLTHQLPFQKYLATYFVLVDFSLVAQYIYYSRRTPSPAVTHPRIYSTRRLSIDRPGSRYRTLSLVAGNVAKAAALAAQHDEHAGPPRSRSGRSTRLHDHFQDSSTSRVSRESDDEVDENALSVLVESFHSEGNGRRPRVSWSMERSAGRRGGSVGRHSVTRTILPHISTTESPTALTGFDSLIRGRSLQRDNELSDDTAAAELPHRRSKSGRRGSSMIFFGVFALFSVSFFAAKPSFVPFVSHAGTVLSARDINPNLQTPLPLGHVDDHIGAHFTTAPSNERVIGRIFAWLCTTLYLTSRLPQIWKNYIRQSVQGLSMALFVFAFLGNTFYVVSILTSPNVYLPAPVSTDFIKESIPYLLGSGGTLVFDITIVTQSFLYRPKRMHKRYEAETEGLIANDALDNSVESLDVAERTISIRD